MKNKITGITKRICTFGIALAIVLMSGFGGTASVSAASISLANGEVTDVTEVDGLETAITGRVIVASQSVNVGSLNGSVYCVAQPGIRVYEYMTVNYGGTTYSLIQYGTGGYAFTASSAWYAEGEIPSDSTATDANAEWIAQVAAEKATRSEMYGRFTIPSVGIDVAIFTHAGSQSGLGAWKQAISDAEDSAVFYASKMYSSTKEGCPMSEYEWIMGDHASQSFANLIKVQVGDIAYINDGNTVTAYQCVRVCDGINNGLLYDSDGVSVRELNAGGFLTYTCKDSTGYSVAMRFWQPVTE